MFQKIDLRQLFLGFAMFQILEKTCLRMFVNIGAANIFCDGFENCRINHS